MSDETGKAKLFAALARAGTAARAVHKGAKHEQGYKYASSEALFEEARPHLHDNGLTIVPTGCHVHAERIDVPMSTRARGDHLAPAYVATLSYLVTHESGESIEVSRDWPVVPQAGRSLDKALAATATTALAYLVRDLLLLPRVDHEVDREPVEREARRSDRRAERGPGPKRPPAPGPRLGLPTSVPVDVAASVAGLVSELLSEIEALGGSSVLCPGKESRSYLGVAFEAAEAARDPQRAGKALAWLRKARDELVALGEPGDEQDTSEGGGASAGVPPSLGDDTPPPPSPHDEQAEAAAIAEAEAAAAEEESERAAIEAEAFESVADCAHPGLRIDGQLPFCVACNEVLRLNEVEAIAAAQGVTLSGKPGKHSRLTLARAVAGMGGPNG